MNKKGLKRIVDDFMQYEKFYLEDTRLEIIVQELSSNSLVTNRTILADMDEDDSNDDQYYIVYVDCEAGIDNSLDKLKNDITESIADITDDFDKNNTKVSILVITTEFKYKQLAAHKISKEVIVNAYNKNILKRNLSLNYEFVSNINNQQFTIGIESRIRSLENHCMNNNIEVDGYVLTASLVDIIKIYNKIGDRLFSRNVRYGINDKLNLEKSIVSTLCNEPEMFWFLNNGISITVSDSDFGLFKNGSIALKYDSTSKFSIINGAQTISIAAKKYYSSETTPEEREQIGIAKVLLRLAKVTDGDKSVVEKISIGLNRQKPITENDIYYTLPFVQQLNSIHYLYDDKKYSFEIVRRGSNYFSIGHFEVQEFAQIVKSYGAQKPCEARTSLKIKVTENEEDIEFTEKDVFRNEIISEIDENTKFTLFKKFYKPVNFAAEIDAVYSKAMKKIVNQLNEGDPKIKILKYSKWLFVSYLIYIMNDKDYKDFSEFSYDQVNIDEISDILFLYIEAYYKVMQATTTDFDNNHFKNNTNYIKFRDNINQCKNELNTRIAGLRD